MGQDWENGSVFDCVDRDGIAGLNFFLFLPPAGHLIFVIPRGSEGSFNSFLLFLIKPIRTQVDPIRVLFFDQSDFFVSSPSLELFFAFDRRVNIAGFFEVGEKNDIVFMSEARKLLSFVFPDSTLKVICDADVENA